MRTATRVLLVTLLLLSITGCGLFEGRPQLLPNKNPDLRKTPAAFAADAAKRHPFPESVPMAETLEIRAETDYTFDNLDVLNFSGRDVNDVEVWVNESYVVYLPTLQNDVIVKIPFRALYNAFGEHFPTNNRRETVESVHLLVNGELLSIETDIKD